jgi:predicted transcriptional regulator
VDSSTFAALADPNRLQIVEMLRDGPASVGEIADRLVLRQPQTSKHLKTLADARVRASTGTVRAARSMDRVVSPDIGGAPRLDGALPARSQHETVHHRSTREKETPR